MVVWRYAVKTVLCEIGFWACNALYSFETQIIGLCIPSVKSVKKFFPCAANIYNKIIYRYINKSNISVITRLSHKSKIETTEIFIKFKILPLNN